MFTMCKMNMKILWFIRWVTLAYFESHEKCCSDTSVSNYSNGRLGCIAIPGHIYYATLLGMNAYIKLPISLAQ